MAGFVSTNFLLFCIGLRLIFLACFLPREISTEPWQSINIVRKDLVDQRTIRNGVIDESLSGLGILCYLFLNLGESPLLDGHIVIVIDIIDVYDVARRLGS